MSIPQAISKAAQAASAVVAGISPDQLDNSTPCDEWDVRALGNHLTGFLPYSANAARRGPAMEGEAPDFTANEWAATFAHLATDAATAWAEEGALDGETEFGPGTLPAQYAAGITLMELAVHGWDLATATGQTMDLDDETAALAAQVSAQAANGAPEGFFGKAVEVPEGATAFDRGLGAVGRNPA